MADPIVTTRVRFRAEFRDEDGVLIDPTTVTWTVQKPDGTVAEPAGDEDHPSVGVYYLWVVLDAPGKWLVEAQGDGTVIVAGEKTVKARKSKVDA
jgi:hypothetical protein